MYILAGITLALIALLFVLARLPQFLADRNQSTMDTTQDVGETTEVVLATNKGDITIELFTELMPITAGNFLSLVEDGFYDGIKFHRVIDGFMLQAGDPLSKDDSQIGAWGTGGPGYTIEDEHIEHPLLTNVRGTLSMANAGPNSGGSQFFINLVDNTNLDFDKPPLTSKHPVFGRVIEGMDVVDAIGKAETDQRDRPVEPVIIETARVVGQDAPVSQSESEPDAGNESSDEIRLDITE